MFDPSEAAAMKRLQERLALLPASTLIKQARKVDPLPAEEPVSDPANKGIERNGIRRNQD